MKDREFINMVIDSYLSYATDPHMATLNNTVANRLRDIADKLDSQSSALKSIFEKKIVDIQWLKASRDYKEYNAKMLDLYDLDSFLTEEEFELLRKWLKCLSN